MIVLGILAALFVLWRLIHRYRLRRAPVGRVVIDRYGPERAIFPREVTRREIRRRRYRG